MDVIETSAAEDGGPMPKGNAPFIRSGHLTAAGFSEHRIYWEEYGTPEGEPVMVLHGGPGVGSHISFTRFFDPERYRIILFDQRGCGKSTPSAGDDDPTAALTDNTTAHLIDDILALRQELNICGGMHVFGGSWGSTLALAYAIARPATVPTLILRGVFLCRRVDVDYFLQGNATAFAADPLAMPVPGAYLDFSDGMGAVYERHPAGSAQRCSARIEQGHNRVAGHRRGTGAPFDGRISLHGLGRQRQPAQAR
jgi:proline iminopeptidase